MSFQTKIYPCLLYYSYIILISALHLNICRSEQKTMKPDILRQILFKVSNSSAQNNHNEQQQMNKNENLTGSESILNIFDTNWRPQFLLSDHNNKLDIQINSIPNQQTNSQQQFLPESSLSLMEPNSLLLSAQPELLFNFQPQMFTTPSAFLPTYSLDEFTSFGLPPLDLSNDWKFDNQTKKSMMEVKIISKNYPKRHRILKNQKILTITI
ncbi:hypothetical protein BLA29_002784 [Euroglyphus maynei]|uniref:Uncharacterized protein n=1 Tax=Euroglyphus maynei TaxID=6958 RepID=A0A1Y3BBC4_EURMA|nr:hypothetical protein BLA29_002784 [Euroglyphus maynei]